MERPWAITCWAPATFLGIEVNRLSAKVHSSTGYRRISRDDRDLEQSEPPSERHRGPRTDDGVASTGELSGIYFGILNIYSTLPQFVATFISMIVFSILEPGKTPELAHEATPEKRDGADNPNAISVCLFIGALAALGAAYATRRLKYLD